MFARASAVLVLVGVLLLAAAAGPASATPVPPYKLYVSISTAADGSGHVEGYALDATTLLTWPDALELKVTRGGVDQTPATGQGFASLPSFAVQPGDVVTITDTDTLAT